MLDSIRVKESLLDPLVLAVTAVLLVPLVLDRSAAAESAPAKGPISSVARSRDSVQAIARVMSLLHSEPALAAARLQQLLDSPSDSYLISEDGDVEGAHESALELLRQQAPQIRAAYENVANLTAVRLLEEARATKRPELYREIAHRFYATAAGFEAVDMIATRYLDRGDHRTAARLWLKLIQDSLHTQRVTPMVRLKAAYAAKLSGEAELAARHTASISKTRLRIGLSLQTPDSWLYSASNRTEVGGSAPPESLAPAFPPEWIQSTVEGESSVALGMWEESRLAEEEALLSSAGALVAGENLILRKSDGLAAVSLADGLVRWQVRTRSREADAGDSDQFDADRDWADTIYGNSILGALAGNGGNVYALDHVGALNRPRNARPVAVFEAGQGTVTANCLMAYSLKSAAADGKPLWKIQPQMAADGGVTGNRLFLGPPLIAQQTLLILAEQRQEISLLGIASQTGTVLWQQPLCNVPTPLPSDDLRASTLCQPALHSGIVICPTNAGFLMGYDLALGQLVWVHDYSRTEPDQTTDTSEGDDTEIAGDPLFPSRIHCQDGRVYFLPHDSQQIQCIDVKTGQEIWTKPREEDLAIAAIDSSGVLMLSSHGCRLLSHATGDDVWSRRLGVIAGTGLSAGIAGDHAPYLIPLAEGRVVAIDPATGRSLGFDQPRQRRNWQPAMLTVDDRAESPTEGDPSAIEHDAVWRPGNLLLSDRGIISVRPREAVLLPSAQRKLASLPPDSAESQDRLERARCLLAGGDLERAEPLLDLLLSDSDATTTAAARPLLKELCYLRLETISPERTDALVEKIAGLIEGSEEWGRLLLTAARYDLRINDQAALFRHARHFAKLNLSAPIPMPGDETRLISAASWVPEIREHLGEMGQKAVLAELKSDDPLASTSALSPQDLLFLNKTAAAERHRDLAMAAMNDGDLQAAELHMQRAGLSVGPHQWDRDFRECVMTACAAESESTAVRTLSAAPLDDSRRASRVTITGQLWPGATSGVVDTFSEARRTFYFHGNQPYCVVDRGDIRQARLAVMNLDLGVCLGEIEVPSRLRMPVVSRQPSEGHFFPITTVGMVHGMSLLEAHREKPLWSTKVPGGDGGVLPQIGPYSGSFCTIQTRNELTVIDPMTGQIRWQRTHISSDAGLHGHYHDGLLGDEQVLLIREKDGSAYTTYDTTTGAMRGRGTLPVDLRRQHRAFGRKFFFVEAGAKQSKARLWDALTEQDLLSLPFEGKFLTTSVGSHELLLLFGDGRLVLVDCIRGEVSLETSVGKETAERTHNLQAITRDGTLIVSLYQDNRTMKADEKEIVEQYVNDLPMTSTHFQGEWIALDRETGKQMWTRRSGQRTLITGGPTGPFLIAVSRLLHVQDDNRKTLLVEAIDPATGHVLASNDRLLADQILQIHHQPKQKRVRLGGMQSTIDLDYELEPQPRGGLNDGVRISTALPAR